MTVEDLLQLIRRWRDAEQKRFRAITHSEEWQRLWNEAENIERQLEAVGFSIGRDEDTNEIILIPSLDEKE